MSSPSIERLARPYLFFVMVGAGFLVVASLLHVLLPVPLGLTFAELIVLGGLTLLYTSAMREEARWPSLRPPRVVWWSWPLLVVLGVVLGLLANVVAALLVSVVPGWDELARQYTEQVKRLLEQGAPWQQVAATLSVVLVAPVTEELAFRRGVLGLQSVSGEPARVSMWTNGALFALLHMNRLTFAPLLLLGAALARLTMWSRSVWPAILVHAMVNLTNGVLVPRLAGEAADLQAQAIPTAQALGGALVLGGLALALMRALRDPLQRDATDRDDDPQP